MFKILWYMLTKKKHMVIWGNAGLGDFLLGTPTFRALKEYDPEMTIFFVCMSDTPAQLFENNPHLEVVKVTMKQVRLFWGRLPNMFPLTYGEIKPSVTCNTRAQNVILDMFNDYMGTGRFNFSAPQPLTTDMQLDIFIDDAEDQAAKQRLVGLKKVITMNVTSRCSRNHWWPADKWQALVDSMPDCTFVQLGLPDEKRITGTLDMRQLSMREQLAIMKNGDSFVGVDTFWSHASNAFMTPGVVLFGDSVPEVWGHVNNINLYKKQRCSPCIDLVLGQFCPYDNKCMKLIEVSEVKHALLTQLGERQQLDAVVNL